MPSRFRRSTPTSTLTTMPTANLVDRMGVVTVAYGDRVENLELQRMFLHDVMPGAKHAVVVDDIAAAHLTPRVTDDPDVEIIVARSASGRTLSTARGRNCGARALFAAGRHLALFLHPDSVPLPGLFEAFVAAGARGGHFGSWIFNGPVTYLREEDDLWTMSQFRARRLTNPSPERVFPPVGDVMSNDDHHLFMSDNFVVARGDWQALGGFCEDLIDEDEQQREFAERARAAGMGMAWVGGAHALRVHPGRGRAGKLKVSA